MGNFASESAESAKTFVTFNRPKAEHVIYICVDVRIYINIRMNIGTCICICMLDAQTQ
jgi:hypothetical protein